MSLPVIHFDYEFSPYGQKTKLLLAAAGVEFSRCDQPAVLPRKDLEDLGITYRRIPLLAIGKDVYFDTHLITETILSQLANGRLPTAPTDLGFKEWGDNTFAEALGLVSPAIFTPDFKKDRSTVNFNMVRRPDFESLRPSAIASFRQRLHQVEDVFLAKGGPFINGDKISLADVHVAWILRWALVWLEASKEPSLSKEHFPKCYKLVESLPKENPTVLSAEETHKTIREGQFTGKGPTSVQKDDPYGLTAGTVVHVEAFDTDPGAHPQAGKLIGTDDYEIVIEGPDEVHFHFPRIAYIVRSEAEAPKKK